MSDRFFRKAWSELPVEPLVRLPWQSGCWKTIICNEPVYSTKPFTFKRSVPPLVQHDSGECSREETVKRSKPQTSSATSWMQIVKTTSDESWMEFRDSQFQVALKRWLDVLLQLPASCHVVLQLRTLGNVSQQLRMLRDLFYKKAPQTLLKRCHSFLRFVEHLKDTGQVFPGSEQGFYAFLCSLKDAGVATSTVQSIVQSLNFAQHVVGLVELMHLTSSKRCAGAVGVRNTGPKKQASPFKVSEIYTLHEVLHDTAVDNWTRVFVGIVLLAVYSRSRWSDLQHAESLHIDCDSQGNQVYAELQISSHKCRESAAFRNTFLVAVAPSLGVCPNPWLSEWVKVRELLQIDFNDGLPTLPAPDSASRPTKRPLSTEEMKGWLHLILAQRGHDLTGRRLTSHSCKCTVLSWLSKHGDDWADRMALGGHVSFMKSAIVYSRDAMARPIRILEALLGEVRRGEFCPDETRSGRFKAVRTPATSESTGHANKDSFEHDWTLLGQSENSSQTSQGGNGFAVVDLVESEAEQVKQETGDSSGSSSDAMTTSSSEDEVGAALTGAARPMKLPTIPDELKLVQHTKYKTLHLMEQQNSRVMLCGRMVVDGRYALASLARFDTPCCHTCWKHKHEYER